jgi:hypothetical protein
MLKTLLIAILFLGYVAVLGLGWEHMHPTHTAFSIKEDL